MCWKDGSVINVYKSMNAEWKKQTKKKPCCVIIMLMSKFSFILRAKVCMLPEEPVLIAIIIIAIQSKEFFLVSLYNSASTLWIPPLHRFYRIPTLLFWIRIVSYISMCNKLHVMIPAGQWCKLSFHINWGTQSFSSPIMLQAPYSLFGRTDAEPTYTVGSWFGSKSGLWHLGLWCRLWWSASQLCSYRPGPRDWWTILSSL